MTTDIEITDHEVDEIVCAFNKRGEVPNNSQAMALVKKFYLEISLPTDDEWIVEGRLVEEKIKASAERAKFFKKTLVETGIWIDDEVMICPECSGSCQRYCHLKYNKNKYNFFKLMNEKYHGTDLKNLNFVICEYVGKFKWDKSKVQE